MDVSDAGWQPRSRPWRWWPCHQSGRGLEGAAIGGALGAVGGNAVGNSQDQRNYQRQQYYRPQPRPYYGY